MKRQIGEAVLAVQTGCAQVDPESAGDLAVDGSGAGRTRRARPALLQEASRLTSILGFTTLLNAFGICDLIQSRRF